MTTRGQALCEVLERKNKRVHGAYQGVLGTDVTQAGKEARLLGLAAEIDRLHFLL